MCSNHGEKYLIIGICSDDKGFRKCRCTEGWKGLYCHIKSCISQMKCLNGG